MSVTLQISFCIFISRYLEERCYYCYHASSWKHTQNFETTKAEYVHFKKGIV